MQIGSTELLIILIIIIIAYGFYKARHSSSPRSSAFRAGQGTQNGPAGAESPGSAWSEEPSNNAGAANTAGARDPYVVLNVPRNATKEEVVVAYKKLAQMYHPDKVAGLAPEYHLIAEQKMKEINTAYEQIRNRGWR